MRRCLGFLHMLFRGCHLLFSFGLSSRICFVLEFCLGLGKQYLELILYYFLGYIIKDFDMSFCMPRVFNESSEVRIRIEWVSACSVVDLDIGRDQFRVLLGRSLVRVKWFYHMLCYDWWLSLEELLGSNPTIAWGGAVAGRW